MDLEKLGKYQITKKLGEGGFGSVLLATDSKLKRNVALKVLHPQVASDEMLLAYFEREAVALALLDHTNIVRVYEYDQIDGVSFISMEYVEGTNLDVLLKEQRSLSLEKIISIFRQLLSALGYAHERGIIHRDIKPSNIMLNKGDVVKITDFGIAKVAGGAKLTKTGTGAGSLLYMSPEQIKGTAIDNRSDLYAVGVTLYQVMTGKMPFEGDSDWEIMTGHLEKVPTPPREFRSDVPKEIEQIILKALEKKPEKRFQSAEEMSNALAEIKATGSAMDDKTIRTDTIRSQEAVKKPFNKGLIGIAAGVLVLIVAAMFFWPSSKKTEIKSNFTDSLSTAINDYHDKEYQLAAEMLGILSESNSASASEKEKVNEYLAASKYLAGDSTTAKQLVAQIYHNNQQVVFPLGELPDQINNYLKQLVTPVTTAVKGGVELSLQGFEPFRPISISLGKLTQIFESSPAKFDSVPAGRYELKIEGKDMKPIRDNLLVSGGVVTRSFLCEQNQSVGAGSILATVENSKIFEPITIVLDGKTERKYQDGGVVFDKLDSGPHEVMLKSELGRQTLQVTLSSNQQTAAFHLPDPSSNKSFSTLTVSVQLQGDPDADISAQVLVDDKSMGDTPFKEDQLLNGPHKVTVARKDFVVVGDKARFIDLNKDASLEFTIKKK
jgi:serine/threonine protein kinase